MRALNYQGFVPGTTIERENPPNPPQPEIIWPHFWAIQIILFVLIAMYCTVHELVRVIGREKALRIFFGPMPAPEV